MKVTSWMIWRDDWSLCSSSVLMTTEMACSCALYFVDHSVLNQNLTQTGEVSKHFDVVNIFTFENHSLLLENYIQAFDD